ncbi:MAG: flagellar biosynthetic protein FliO [Rhodospirillaceae bacterium]
MDTDAYLRFALSFALVIGLILVAGALLRRFSGGMPSWRGTRKGLRRLQVLETLAVDPKRRLVLVRRDGVEHLILVGGGTDLVIEAGMPAASTRGSDPSLSAVDTSSQGTPS